MPSDPDIQHDLQLLETELRRLELEYNMFFAGTRIKPPWDTRARVEALLKRYDRAPIPNTADRFRFSTLQQRYAAFADLWERGMKAREEGRPGPFAAGGSAPPARAAESAGEQVLCVTMIADPVGEIDKIQRLYQTLARARRQLGERTVPFHKFAEIVRQQVAELQASGNRDVAFRASVGDGKVHLTAKALREPKPADSSEAAPRTNEQ